MPSPSDSFSETFGLTRGMKAMISFGVVFFSLGLLGSIAFLFFPSLNKDPAPRWTWPVCAAAYMTFIALFISIWKKRNDTVEVTKIGVASHSSRGRDVQLRWDEIATVEEYAQRGCLVLRSRSGKRIRVEHQFGNFPDFLNLLEQNLGHQESGAECAVFYKIKSFYITHLLVMSFFASYAAWACISGLYWGALLLLLTLPSLKALLMEPFKIVVESEQLSIVSLFSHRAIVWADLPYIRLNPSLSENGATGLEVVISERQSGKETKLTRFQNIFHLYMLVKNNHERSRP